MQWLLPLYMLAALGVAAPAMAEPKQSGPEILERDAQGHATKVKVDGYVMDVCTPEKTDGCINPRDAGLDQGNREINYWPGKPASEIDHPLPVEKPETLKDTGQSK